MPTKNETSTITLPEYHNLLALLLLNLNTPPVSSSSTTQEEEMIKKRKKRDNAHTESGVRQQNRASRQVPDPDKETDLTHKTHHQKERDECHTKKERQTKPVYHHEHANTNHVHKRRITHQRQKQKRKTT